MAELQLFGADLFGDPIEQRKVGLLSKRFEFPPFSVLNARSGQWQERRRAWLSLGIRGERGRSCIGKSAWNDLSLHQRKAESTRKIAAVGDSATVFDPVLSELMYRWLCPAGGMVLDPFAGGSVRGIVAGLLGYSYHGIELRAEQVAENVEQARGLVGTAAITWQAADARKVTCSAPAADFIFSCPPYGDLERYSDNPCDLSTMPYPEFLKAYREIVSAACGRLRDHRFACFLVGDFRDTKTGHYRGFVGDTVAAFVDSGLALYNDCVVLTPVGSLSMRTAIPFESTRKLGKAHQNLLVFLKGDARQAAKACTRKAPNA